MNSNAIESSRRELNTNDLLLAESWIRERGRASVTAWSGLSVEARADILAVGFALGVARVHKRGYFQIIRLQRERLRKNWSLITTAKKLQEHGMVRAKPEQVFGVEVNPRKRTELDRTFVRAVEDALNLSWEDLITVIPPQRIPVPKKAYAEATGTEDE